MQAQQVVSYGWCIYLAPGISDVNAMKIASEFRTGADRAGSCVILARCIHGPLKLCYIIRFPLTVMGILSCGEHNVWCQYGLFIIKLVSCAGFFFVKYILFYSKRRCLTAAK